VSERADIVTEHAGVYVHTNIYTCLFGDALLRRVMLVITLNGKVLASLETGGLVNRVTEQNEFEGNCSNYGI